MYVLLTTAAPVEYEFPVEYAGTQIALVSEKVLPKSGNRFAPQYKEYLLKSRNDTIIDLGEVLDFLWPVLANRWTSQIFVADEYDLTWQFRIVLSGPSEHER